MNDINTQVKHRKNKMSMFYAFIYFIGELCLTVSVILGLFIVWQVFYTTWEVDGLKKQAVERLHKQSPSSPKIAKNLHFDAPPPIEKPRLGEVFGALYVPSWGAGTRPMPIGQGSHRAVIDKGYAGHYIQTALPGEIGNFSLAGHRLTYGNNFDKLPNLAKDDVVAVETKKIWLIYKTTEHEIVTPDRVEVIAPVPNNPYAVPTSRLMTMTTCSSSTGGRWGNTHRWITHAKFDHWVEKSDGIPAEIAKVYGKLFIKHKER